MPWTDEMVESLKKMWNEGLSTGEIGKRLGVSKNSIVGKVHRLQLVARPSPIKKKDSSAKKEENAKAKSAPKTMANPSPAKTETIHKEKTVVKPTVESKTQPELPKDKKVEKLTSPVTPKTSKDDLEIYANFSIPVIQTNKKSGDKITVTDLDNHTCRWPIGDPKDENFHFCGAPVRIGQTYCEEHATIAYVKNLKK